MLTAAFSDAHREDYQPTYQDRFLLEAESLIRGRLEAYSLEFVLQDANRVAVLSPIYTLPTGVTLIRHLLRSDGYPLDQVDETLIAQYTAASVVIAFCIRPNTLIVAGTPGATDTLTLQYFGMPTPLLLAGDSNTLLTDYPELYKEAVMVSIFKRAQNLEAAAAMIQSVTNKIDEINRKVKKLLGGARASNPYNTTWRSSY